MISNNLWQPLTASDTQTQNKSSNLTSRGFQKHITYLDSVHFQIWPFTTSHELKWPRILKNPKDPFLAWSQLSKNILFEKSQKSHFSKPFSSTTSTGRNGPKPKFTIHNPQFYGFITPHSSVHIPHSTLHIPQSTFHTPHSTFLTPHSSFLSFMVLYILKYPNCTTYMTVVAAPLVSALMTSILPLGLMEMPPMLKVTPFHTSNTGFQSLHSIISTVKA